VCKKGRVEPLVNIMIKIIYYNKKIDDTIKNISLNENIELNYWGLDSDNENNEIKKEKFFLFRNLFSKKIAVGTHIPDGLIPFIINGLNVISDVSWELVKGIALHEFIKIYEVTQTVQNKETNTDMKDNRVLQIITDEQKGIEDKLKISKKSISFVFEKDLDDVQLEKAYLEIPYIRNKINDLLKIAKLIDVTRIECVYKKEDGWSIEFINCNNGGI